VLYLVLFGALAAIAGLIGSGTALPGAERREDANLVATRGGRGQVRRWIVAHLDSKAQGHSMAGRLITVWVLLASVGALGLLCLVRWFAGSPLPWPAAGAAAAATLLAGALAGRGRLSGTSPGARDNGTGLLALLEAARRSTDPRTGFLVTGAEEFGLVGSRIFTRLAGPLAGCEAINLDTLADRGRLFIVTHDRRGRSLAARLRTALQPLGAPVQVRRLPAGILVDSLPLARRGAAAVTLARLDWPVLRLIHTARDTLRDLDPGFALGVGEALAGLPTRD
jgi:hypothetical protein